MSGARSLANALLDLGLPTIKEWLRGRLGPVADVEAVVTEGLLLHLDRVTLPIGPRGLLTLTRATCALSRGARVGLPNVRLHAFEGGVLRFGGPGEPCFAADIAFTADASPSEDAWVAGRLVITNATWTVGASARDEHVPMSGAARLVVTSSKWSLEQGELRTDSAEVKFSGGGQLEGEDALERAQISLRDARTRHFLDAVTALTGAPLALEVPEAAGDPKLTGEAAWDARATPAGRCDARIEADLLSLAVRGTASRTGASTSPASFALDGKVEGDLRVAKVLAAAGIPETSWPEPEDVLRLDLAVEGSPARPSARGTARAEAMRFRLGRPRFEPPLSVTAIALDLASDDARLTLSGGLAIGGATLSLRGELPFAPALEKNIALTLESFDAPAIAALARAGGLADMVGLEGKDESATFSIPIHTRAFGEIEMRLGPGEKGLAIDGAVAFETPRSALVLDPLCWSDGDATGTRLRGALALADALAAGLFPSDVRPTEVGVVTGDLGISGAANDLVLDGRVAANRVELAIASRPDVPAYAFETATARLRITRRSILYDDAAFSGYGGAFRLEGEAPFGDGLPATPAIPATPATPATYEDRLRVRIDGADARFIEALGRLATGGLAVRRERRGQARPKDEILDPGECELLRRGPSRRGDEAHGRRRAGARRDRGHRRRCACRRRRSCASTGRRSAEEFPSRMRSSPERSIRRCSRCPARARPTSLHASKRP